MTKLYKTFLGILGEEDSNPELEKHLYLLAKNTLTVKDLKKIIQKLPDEMPILLRTYKNLYEINESPLIGFDHVTHVDFKQKEHKYLELATIDLYNDDNEEALNTYLNRKEQGAG